MSGLLMRRGWPLALMLCADRVPIVSTHFKSAMTQTGSPDPRIDLVCITSSCPRQFLQNFGTPSSLPGLTSLNRSGFDATSLWHFDAAEQAPSTASLATEEVEATRRSMSALPPKADKWAHVCEVRLVPCVDGSELARLFFTFAGWSVQPCVRPVSAAHQAAGHNALRGSGPGQKPAFDNALALMGCPDRRIGRLCITCCLPSQPSHHAGCRRDLGHAASATGSL